MNLMIHVSERLFLLLMNIPNGNYKNVLRVSLIKKKKFLTIGMPICYDNFHTHRFLKLRTLIFVKIYMCLKKSFMYNIYFIGVSFHFQFSGTRFNINVPKRFI